MFSFHISQISEDQTFFERKEKKEDKREKQPKAPLADF